MIDPWLSEPRERVRIGVKDCMGLDHELSGAQMPPHVRISDVARRHGEKTQRQDGHKHPTRLEELHHSPEDNTLPRLPRYKIASPLRAWCAIKLRFETLRAC